MNPSESLYQRKVGSALNHMTLVTGEPKDDQASSSIQTICVFCCETLCEKSRPMAHARKCKSRMGRTISKSCTVKRSEMTKQATWYGTPTGLEKGDGTLVERIGP